jgi:glyceraldehyde 3-phosphate dehydrogenase
MANKIKIGINGFGRIGRSLFRLLDAHPLLEVIAVNDLADINTLAHLLKYDSIHGNFKTDLEIKANTLLANNQQVVFSQEAKIENIKWPQEVQLVVEATGKFKTREEVEKHLSKHVKKVVLSVPPISEDIPMVVLGVNDHIIQESDTIISNASCTTNNAAPMLQVMHQHFGVKQAYISTVHSFTSDQNLHDQPHRDLRRARAATQSIIPTTTGAAKALTKIFPDLAQVIGGCGIRVPVPNGSLTDMTLHLEKEASINQINDLFKKAAAGYLKGVLAYTEDPIVSIDIVGNSHSCVFDGLMTSVIDGHLVKLIGWYDNERGYSSRIIDLIIKLCDIK